MHAARERRVASEKAADELIQAQNEAERTASSQIDIAVASLHLPRNY